MQPYKASKVSIQVCARNQHYNAVFLRSCSATMPEGVEAMASTALKDPIRIMVGKRYADTKCHVPKHVVMLMIRNAATATLRQELVFCGTEEGKILAVRQLLQQARPFPLRWISIPDKDIY